MLSRAAVLARRATSGRIALSLSSAASKRRPKPWSALLEALDDDRRAMVITRRDKPFTIMAVNDPWTKLCGYSQGEAVGKSLAMIQGPKTSHRDVDRLTRLLRGPARARRAIDMELVNYTRDKRAFLNHVHVTPVDVDLNGAVTPMFVGSLSFRRWVGPEARAAAPARAAATVAKAQAAAEASAAHFSLASALARSAPRQGEPLAALPVSASRHAYFLDRMP